MTSRPEDGDGGDFPVETPLTAFFPPAAEVELLPPAGRGSGDKSKSDSGDEAYDSREVIGNKKSSDRYSSNYEGCEERVESENKPKKRDINDGHKRQNKSRY